MSAADDPDGPPCVCPPWDTLALCLVHGLYGPDTKTPPAR